MIQQNDTSKQQPNTTFTLKVHVDHHIVGWRKFLLIQFGGKLYFKWVMRLKVYVNNLMSHHIVSWRRFFQLF